MGFVGGRVVRKAVLVDQARAVDAVDAFAKPDNALLVVPVDRGVEEKEHQGATDAGVSLRRVVIRSPFKIGWRVGERWLHRFSVVGVARSSYLPFQPPRGERRVARGSAPWRLAGSLC